MGRHTAAQDPLHVLYLGSSAELGALRRVMEAHGAITRSRLTPAVAVVVAESSVPAHHPTLRAANTLGIPVMEPAEAAVQFAAWRGYTQSPLAEPRSPAAPSRPPLAWRSWLFRRSTR
ncbi:MAG: hypothetical protein ACRDRU_11375 [Pseudonocardiaceae bacterium]